MPTKGITPMQLFIAWAMRRSRGRWPITLLLALIMVLVSAPPTLAQGGINVSLVAITPPDKPVGTPLTWVAIPTGVAARPQYQFSVGRQGEALRIVRDFNVFGVLQWAPLQEGIYTVRVVMKDPASGATAEATTQYTVLPRVTGNERAVSPTANPLVALYSRPSCATGYVRVRYRAQGTLFWQYTAWRPCAPDNTMMARVSSSWIRGPRPIARSACRACTCRKSFRSPLQRCRRWLRCRCMLSMAQRRPALHPYFYPT